MKNLKTSIKSKLSNNDLKAIKGGVPDGWVKVECKNGNTYYYGPNGSTMVVYGK